MEHVFKASYPEYHEEITKSFMKWYQSGKYTDVTIHAGGQCLKAHKLVLAANSPFFNGVLMNAKEPHSHLYFSDVPFPSMKSLVEYMYSGYLVVPREFLPECLRLGDSLRVRGITDAGTDEYITEPAAVSEKMNNLINELMQQKSLPQPLPQPLRQPLPQRQPQQRQEHYQLHEEQLQVPIQNQSNRKSLTRQQLKKRRRKAERKANRIRTNAGIDLPQGISKMFFKQTRNTEELQLENFYGPGFDVNLISAIQNNALMESGSEANSFSMGNELMSDPNNGEASEMSFGNHFEEEYENANENDFKNENKNENENETDNNDNDNDNESENNDVDNGNGRHCYLSGVEDLDANEDQDMSNNIPHNFYNNGNGSGYGYCYDYDYDDDFKNDDVMDGGYGNENDGNESCNDSDNGNANVDENNDGEDGDHYGNEEGDVEDDDSDMINNNECSNYNYEELNQSNDCLAERSKTPFETDVLKKINNLRCQEINNLVPSMLNSCSTQGFKTCKATIVPTLSSLDRKQKIRSLKKVSKKYNSGGKQKAGKRVTKVALKHLDREIENLFGDSYYGDITKDNDSQSLQSAEFVTTDPNESNKEASMYVLEEDDQTIRKASRRKNPMCPPPTDILKNGKPSFSCGLCKRVYTHKSNYRRHYMVFHKRCAEAVFQCPMCKKKFTRSDNRTHHIRRIHGYNNNASSLSEDQAIYVCPICKKAFTRSYNRTFHLAEAHGIMSPALFDKDFKLNFCKEE